LLRTAALGDWAVRIAVDPWVRTPDFVPARSEIDHQMLEAFRTRGTMMPRPSERCAAPRPHVRGPKRVPASIAQKR
jgi:small-conductance mechanosensitive channel